MAKLGASSVTRNKISFFVSMAVATVGLAASFITLYPFVSEWLDDTTDIRNIAADCRASGFRSADAGDIPKAREFFNCALTNLRKAAARGDGLSHLGLAVTYSDRQVIQSLGLQRSAAIRNASIHWCEARRLGIRAAVSTPPFEKTVDC